MFRGTNVLEVKGELFESFFLFKNRPGIHASIFAPKQVKAYFDRALDKMRVEGATITSKIDEDHLRLVEEIFGKEDKDKDGFISLSEFSGPKHDEL